MDGDVGGRIRDLRVRRGLSQAALAGSAGVSGSYLSLIEAGRRPVAGALLETIAGRLGSSVDYLTTGRGGPIDEALEVDLRFAEMALRSGDAAAAASRFETVMAQAERLRRDDLVVDARWGLARTREAVGDLEGAIDEYERLARGPQLPAGVSTTSLAMRICRTYSECNDLSHAIDVGESALRALDEDESADVGSDDAIALASTLVGCYYERGDLTKANALAQTTIALSQQNGSPQARAAALWNAGLVAEERGDLRSATRYLDRALALYSEGDNSRAISLLKVASAWLMLRTPEPPVGNAERLLTEAMGELAEDGTAVDLAYAETELARCRLIEGDWPEAVRLAESTLDRLGTMPRIERARARLIIGHANFDAGDVEHAVAAYTAAAAELGDAGAARQAAQVWRELAEALAGLGRAEEALDAYRRAADAAGVRATPGSPRRSHAAARPAAG